MYNCGVQISKSFKFRLFTEEEQEKIFVIGGGQIYEQALTITDTLYITEIHHAFDGDTFFPTYDKNEWVEVSRDHHEKDERHKYSFDFVVYKRK